MTKAWHLRFMKIDTLHHYSKGKNQTIAFIDTGISADVFDAHRDKIVAYWNVIENSSDVIDHHGHGTEMISVACGDGYKDTYGIAPECRIIIIKAVSDEGKTNNDYLYDGLLYARNNGATIVNISLGGFKTDDNVISLIQEMITDGITIVAAAGDYGNKDLLFPASVPNVISVEALDENQEIWIDSNLSNDSIVRAPGVNIEALTLLNGDTIKDQASGTSQATAIISGYIALLRDYAAMNQSTLSNDGIIQMLKNLNSKDAKSNSEYVNVLKSINKG